MSSPEIPGGIEAGCFQAPPPENFTASALIPPGGIQVFELPRRDVDGTILDQLAYRVFSTTPISTYQFNPLENVEAFSNDASVLLPTATASTDFLVMTREQTFDGLKGFLTVVGVADEPTEVTVTVSAPTLAGVGIPNLAAGDVHTATLNKFDVLNIETNASGADLTGSRVQSDHGVLVYAGSESANAPNTSRCNLEAGHCENDPAIDCFVHSTCAIFALITCCADHLEQQMFPIETWGKQ